LSPREVAKRLKSELEKIRNTPPSQLSSHISPETQNLRELGLRRVEQKLKRGTTHSPNEP